MHGLLFFYIFRERRAMDFIYLVCCDYYDDILQIGKRNNIKGVCFTKEQARECLFSIIDGYKDDWNKRGTKFKQTVSEFGIDFVHSDYEEIQCYILEAKSNEPIFYKECQRVSLLEKGVR